MKRPSFAIAFALLTACTSRSPDLPEDAGADVATIDADVTPTWDTVIEHLDGTLLSMWGSSATDIYAVGGPLGNGQQTLVVHFDGTAWKRLDPKGTDTFWWVYGTSKTDVWMVGEKGRITHYDGAAFKEYPAITTATLFGVWAASKTDAWAVGGTPEGATGAPNDVVLHFDGASWTPSPLPKTLGRTLFKVWGSAADDIYAVGEAGTIWHRKGGAWALETNPAHGTLLTVHGCGSKDIYAVGGRDLLHSDGTTWTAEKISLQNDVNGVSCGSPGSAFVVGFGGSKQRLVSGTWNDDFGTKPFADLHGAWTSPSGELWGVGGNFIGTAAKGVSREGVIGRYGKGSVAAMVTP